MKKARPVIWGVALLALGIVFGGNALGLFQFNVFFDGWWTLFIMVPSAVSLITEKDRLTSLGFLVAGVMLLLAAQDVFSYDVAWKAILAEALILAGISVIIKTISHKDDEKEIEKKVKELENGKGMDAQVAVFSGSEKIYADETFAGSHLVAVFGGVDLDLRKAKFTKDVVIKAFCLFGGIDIKLPEDAQVKLKSGFFFGGVSDDRKSKANKGKYTIYLDASGGFGGVNVSDETTF